MDRNKLDELEKQFQGDLNKKSALISAFSGIVVFLLCVTLILICIGALLWAWNFVADSLSAL